MHKGPEKSIHLMSVLVLLTILATTACRHDPFPSNAVPETKFIDIMVDVHIAEAIYRDRFRQKNDSLQSVPLYLSVLEKHGVNEEQIAKTTAYYTRHPKEYDKVYAEIISKISLMIEEQKQGEELSINPKKN